MNNVLGSVEVKSYEQIFSKTFVHVDLMDFVLNSDTKCKLLCTEFSSDLSNCTMIKKLRSSFSRFGTA